MMSRNSCGSTPRRSASSTVSATPSTSASTQWLRTSFVRWPAPGSGPQSTVVPSASNTGRQRSNGPDARIVSAPCSAAGLEPRTGASMNSPRASCSVASTPIVLICAHTAPFVATPSIACSTAAPSASIVTITSAPAQASAGVSHTVAPSIASARSRVRFQARTPWPAATRLRPIGAPISPVPSNATRISVAQDRADPAQRAEIVVVAHLDHLGGLLDRLLDRRLDDVLAALELLVVGPVVAGVEHPGLLVAAARGAEALGHEQDPDPLLVERFEPRREAGGPAPATADALGQAIQCPALAGARPVLDRRGRRGAHVVEARVLDVEVQAA